MQFFRQHILFTKYTTICMTIPVGWLVGLVKMSQNREKVKIIKLTALLKIKTKKYIKRRNKKVAFC